MIDGFNGLCFTEHKMAATSSLDFNLHAVGFLSKITEKTKDWIAIKNVKKKTIVILSVYSLTVAA